MLWIVHAFLACISSLILDANEVRVQWLEIEMWERRAYKVVFVENCAMLDLIIEIHEDSVLYELRLQEALLVNWTVEDALEAQIPEEVLNVVFGKEVLLEIACEVC